MAKASLAGRGRGSFSVPLVVVSLLVAAGAVFGVGQIKSASIERAYRNTQYAAASVVSVGANRVASVRYLWRGKTETGHLNVSTAEGVDQGDHIGVRISERGGSLQLQTPFNAAVYPWTSVALVVVAGGIVASSFRASAPNRRPRRRWLPAELGRPSRR